MSIGVIPATELLAHIGRVPLCPYQFALAVGAASLSEYFPLFQYKRHTGMSMKTYSRTAS
jgi:hypothetical protein